MTATHYFIGLIIITSVLFVIGLLLPKFQRKGNLADLLVLCQSLLNDNYQLSKSDKFITIIKNKQKIALLTLDNNLSNHSRKMGDSVVINFKTFPNKKSLEKVLLKEKIIIMN